MNKNLWFLVFAIFLVSCASGSHRADQFGRKILQRVEEKKLENGLTILYLRDETLPYVHMTLMLDSGSAVDPEGKDGVAALTVDLLDKGTLSRSALEIANEFGRLGTEFQKSVHVDHSVFSAQALSVNDKELMDLFTDLILNPAFKTEEFQRSRRRLIAQANKRADSPSHFAGVAWESYVFKGHPYSKVNYGTTQTLKRIEPKDINKHYLVHVRPNRAYVAVVGQWSDEFKGLLEARLSEWKAFESEDQEDSSVAPYEGIKIRVVHQPQSVQSQVYVGHPSVARTHPDYFALQVANTMLGGAFQSRLMERIRKELGLTYGVRSTVASREDLGVFHVTTATRTETTAQVIDEIQKIVSKAVEEGLTAEELESTKGYLRGVFPRSIEIPEQLATGLLHLRRLNLPDDEITSYLSRLNDLKLSTVNEAIKKNIRPDNFKVLVYGRRDALQKQLKDREVEWVSQQQAF